MTIAVHHRNSSGSKQQGQQHHQPSPKPSTNQYYSSYQQGVYYAADQTKTLHDTHQTYTAADETAAAVLQQMTSQRHQIQGAHDDVWEMRQATAQVQRELMQLQKKYQEKKRKLYITIAILAMTDFLLFLRIVQCHGNFYCF
ncbi:MAG: hypothetical protein MUF01_11545 [Bryobacterales bacterium]|nr:hypothetical protein [Bryobacterales bacterium]